MSENWLDRTIGYFSPTAGLRRVRARTLSETVKRHFEGGSRTRRTKGWRTSSGSANAEIFQAMELLRDRSRYLVRNNCYAARGIQAIASHTIGEGIIPSYTSGTKKQNDLIAKLWNEWSESTDCDADGVNNYYGLQALIMREIAESGEVLIRRRKRRSSDGLPVPLQLQVIEADYLDHNRNEVLPNGGKIVQGVEYSAIGKIQAYWLYQSHPGDTNLIMSPSFAASQFGASIRIPASEIRHLFRVDRAGQGRGIPWLSPCIIKLRDFDEYDDFQLLRQKIAACYAAYVYDGNPPDLEDLSQDGGDNDIDKIEPGLVEYLPPGKDIKFANPPTVEGFGEYSRIQLTAIATALGITYETLTQDLSNVNFSSGRMGQTAMYSNIGQWRWNMFVPRFARPSYTWFLQALEVSEGVNLPTYYSEWTEPKRESIDPLKEANADIAAIKGGLMTMSEAIRGRGYEPDKVMAERSQELKKMDTLGIKTSSDPRPILKPASGGSV